MYVKILFCRFLWVAGALCLGAQQVTAQTVTLPKPARVVYKCVVSGKVVYTDDPCLNAQKIDIEPTRGLNKATGRVLTGPDVARECQRENMAEALKPLTGMTPAQFATHVHRVNLSSAVQTECKHLDGEIAQLEKLEQASTDKRAAIQNQLFSYRKRFREIKC